MLVDGAEYASETLPGVVVEHGGGRTTSLACGLTKTLAFGVVRPQSSHRDLVQQKHFHLDEGLHLLVIDLRQVQLCLQFDVEPS